MEKTALLIMTPGQPGFDTAVLEEGCTACGFTLLRGGPFQDHEALRGELGTGELFLLLPAVRDDCFGVKMAQEALRDRRSHVIVLYADEMPDSEYLCLAFREGADDIIATSAGREAVMVQLNRAEKLLRSRREEAHALGALDRTCRDLLDRCEKLERANARLEERLLALASAGTRLATGELRLAELNPRALIVASSRSQTASAAESARKLGFEPHQARTGKEALELVTKIKPRVILTGGVLNDMDAGDFARAARRALGENPVIIIAWSGSEELEDEILRPDSGIDDFVPKRGDGQANELLAASLLGSLR